MSAQTNRGGAPVVVPSNAAPSNASSGVGDVIVAAPGPARIFIVRHGERVDHMQRAWRATAPRPHDSPLTANGKAMAEELGRYLAEARGVVPRPATATIHAGGPIASATCMSGSIATPPTTSLLDTTVSTTATHTAPEEAPSASKCPLPGAAPDRRAVCSVVVLSSPLQRCIETSHEIVVGLLKGSGLGHLIADGFDSKSSVSGPASASTSTTASRRPPPPLVVPIHLEPGVIEGQYWMNHDLESAADLGNPFPSLLPPVPGRGGGAADGGPLGEGGAAATTGAVGGGIMDASTSSSQCMSSSQNPTAGGASPMLAPAAPTASSSATTAVATATVSASSSYTVPPSAPDKNSHHNDSDIHQHGSNDHHCSHHHLTPFGPETPMLRASGGVFFGSRHLRSHSPYVRGRVVCPTRHGRHGFGDVRFAFDANERRIVELDSPETGRRGEDVSGRCAETIAAISRSVALSGKTVIIVAHGQTTALLAKGLCPTLAPPDRPYYTSWTELVPAPHTDDGAVMDATVKGEGQDGGRAAPATGAGVGSAPSEAGVAGAPLCSWVVAPGTEPFSVAHLDRRFRLQRLRRAVWRWLVEHGCSVVLGPVVRVVRRTVRLVAFVALVLWRAAPWTLRVDDEEEGDQEGDEGEEDIYRVDSDFYLHYHHHHHHHQHFAEPDPLVDSWHPANLPPPTAPTSTTTTSNVDVATTTATSAVGGEGSSSHSRKGGLFKEVQLGLLVSSGIAAAAAAMAVVAWSRGGGAS